MLEVARVDEGCGAGSVTNDELTGVADAWLDDIVDMAESRTVRAFADVDIGGRVV